MSKNFQSIEELLDEDGEKAAEAEDEATAQQKFAGKAKEIKEKEMEKIMSEKAKSAGLPYIDLAGFPISPEALGKLSEPDSRRLKAVCFFYDGEQLRLGTTQVTAEVKKALDDLSAELHCAGKIYLISETSLMAAQKLYATLPKVREVIRGVKITEEELNKYSESFASFNDLQAEIAKVDVTQIISLILAAAVKSRSSDVHIEGEEKEIKVRFRVDGVLHDVAALDRKIWPKVISRLKLLAKVKINVEDRPQDGRFAIFMQARQIDIRVSFLPTSFGESIVMRLLDSNQEDISFEKLGLIGKPYEELKRQIERPNGMVITTGPTGSGKTTTLYSILKKLNDKETKIITIEDPIEYQLTGVNQSQVSEFYTFAKGLRSIVRQDPDVIMVGEIRDLDTAEIAIQAALTGHLVLSTIHTNDASGTIPRFLSMGVKPYLLAPALNAMIGQRLVRKICESCKTETTISDEQKKRVEDIISKMNESAFTEAMADKAEKKQIDWNKVKFYKGAGCDACQGLGYKGRVGIYEIMVMSAEIEKLIQEGKMSEFDIQAVAVQNGMITMAQDGILKAMQGITSVEEVLRVAE
jgi:type II secretory ATPase GspE/PulE/Tfp pilus assembly ATPase PilB-like protein